MQYRVAKAEDLPAITELVNGCGYYAPMSAAELDGLIIVAEHDGELYGCLWAMVCRRHAFLDYFVVRPGHGRVAVLLGMAMEKALQQLGVQYVRANVMTDNLPAVRVSQAVGMVLQHGYDLAYKRLQDGKQ